MRRISVVLSFIIIQCLILVSCSIPGGFGKNDRAATDTPIKKNMDDIMDKGPVKGGSVSLFSTNPDILNPLLTNNTYVQDFMGLIFEGMVKLDKEQKPVPCLADRWISSADGLEWTFYLKKDVQWHDGMPFSAEDVEFTIETIMRNNVKSVYKRNFQNISTFAAMDRSTFRIVLRTPYSFTAELMTFPIIAKHYFSGEDVVNSQRNFTPVGTGPYKFFSFNPGSDIKLVMNDNWWSSKNADKNLPVPPYIAEVYIKLFNSTNDALNAFQNGEVDAAFLPPGQSSKYMGRLDLSIKRHTGRYFDFIAFNLNKPALGEKAVRQAFAYAIDKVRLINEIMPGEAVPADLPIMPESWLNSSHSGTFSTSTSKAKEMLLQSGWKEDRNGIMYKFINGVYSSLNFELLVNDTNDNRAKAAEKISKQMKEAGINIRIRKVNFDEEINYINSKRFDLVLTGCVAPSIPDISFMYSSSKLMAGAYSTADNIPVYNIAGYRNETVDTNLDRLLVETDGETKKALYKSINDTVISDAPYIGLYFQNNAVLYSKKLKGDLIPNAWNKFNDISKWYMPIR